MAYVTFPLTLVTGIFGMNTRHTPVIGIDADFWIIAGFMLALTAGMFVVFKIKKWI
jgi:magnesium transporter